MLRKEFVGVRVSVVLCCDTDRQGENPTQDVSHLISSTVWLRAKCWRFKASGFAWRSILQALSTKQVHSLSATCSFFDGEDQRLAGVARIEKHSGG